MGDDVRNSEMVYSSKSSKQSKNNNCFAKEDVDKVKSVGDITDDISAPNEDKRSHDKENILLSNMKLLKDSKKIDPSSEKRTRNGIQAKSHTKGVEVTETKVNTKDKETGNNKKTKTSTIISGTKVTKKKDEESSNKKTENPFQRTTRSSRLQSKDGTSPGKENIRVSPNYKEVDDEASISKTHNVKANSTKQSRKSDVVPISNY